jgi:hypothetical protein
MKFEQIDVSLVHAFEVVFVPAGVLAYAITPFVNAALCLITVPVGAPCSLAFKAARRVMNAYHRKYQGHGFDRHRGKMFLVSHTIVVLVLEPQVVDCLLDDGMSIRASKTFSRLGFL